MTRPGTALVLGGGGVTGIAWEIGLLLGLAEHGIDLTEAETLVGTSAGSVVGALVACGEDLEEMYASQFADPSGEEVAKMGAGIIARFALAYITPGSPSRKLRRIGRLAMRARIGDETERVEVIRSRMGDRSWPDRRLLITAVDAGSGEPAVFDKSTGVDLVRAVSASCAVPLVWPPVVVNGRRYVDGGMRSPNNADLARGASHIIVFAPIVASYNKATRVDTQLIGLGPRVAWSVIAPDAIAAHAVNANMLDPRHRAQAARAGRQQARRVLDKVRAAWPC
ncbi:MAG TPA: patatin-like phospholipase family protein [Nocardioidaceae bacterium]|nr:patatin-like phospholipase family protein [Nocardioidaceae bacterium]